VATRNGPAMYTSCKARFESNARFAGTALMVAAVHLLRLLPFSLGFFGGIFPLPQCKVTSRKARNRPRGEPSYVDFEEMLLSEPLGPFHEQQLAPAIDALYQGGMGLIPTDTSHAYVTIISSKKGTRRIYDAKGIQPDVRKPLSLLCSDLSMVSKFADLESLPRKWFDNLRHSLPGPYTFILRATSNVPRVVLQHKSRRKLWQRREVGIRVPDCAVVRHLTSELEEPLLASSACAGPTAVWSTQKNALDFFVAASDIASIWDTVEERDRISTVVDLTMEEPVLIRQGMGDFSMWT